MNIGLKLWSVNTDSYYDAAIKLYEKKLYSFIELYIVPGSLNKLKYWAELDIPFSLHAPHFVHGVNFADPGRKIFNMGVFEEVSLFCERLNPLYLVVHGGTMGCVEETVSQLKNISLKNMLIENKPYHAPLDVNNICRGATVEEIRYIIKETGYGFCLDVGHALCTANFLQVDPYEYLAAFNTLAPYCYHLSDGYIDSEIDRHLHLGHGSYDFKRIFEIIDRSRPIAVETEKKLSSALDDFVCDVEFLNGL